MDKEILIAILMSAVNYIITQTINSRSAQATQDYFKQQLDDLRSTMMDSFVSQRTSILDEMKEQGQMTRDVLKDEH